MSIINEALKKTQQRRKMENEKRAQAKAQSSATEEPSSSSFTFKSQPEHKKIEPVKKKRKPVRKADFLFNLKMASFLTVAALLAMMAFTNYQPVKRGSTPQMQVASKPIDKIKVAFEGVFLSSDMKIALINKKSMHIGETINGMKIVAIDQDTVDLQGINGIIQLRSGATYLI